MAKLDGYLTPPSGDSPEDIVRDYLRAHLDVFGLTGAPVHDLTLRKQYTDVAGIRHLSFLQSVNGVPVFGNGVKANVSGDGRLISLLGSPVAKLPSSLVRVRVTGMQARNTAVRDIAGTGADNNLAAGTAKQVVYAAPDGSARRAWQTVTSPNGHGMWLHVVDAETGRILYRQNLSSDLTASSSGAAAGQLLSAAGHALSAPAALASTSSGKVLVWDSYPGSPTGGKQHTGDLSAKGWLPKNAKTLNGPIAHAFSDVNDNNTVDQGEEITPPAGGMFAFPFKPFTGNACNDPLPCSWDQTKPGSWKTNREQNAAQVYYYLGTYHDHLEGAPIGFTRNSGNFDGRDSDAVQAQTDDGAAVNNGLPDQNHLNNANMSIPPDGQAPTMQMYLSGSGPGYRVLQGNWGDDAAVVYHEYTHGLSSRLVVDADGVSTLTGQQGRAMGEAWSDWYALDFLDNQKLLTDGPHSDGDVNLVPPHWTDELPWRSQALDCPVGSTSAKCPGMKKAGPGGYTYGDYGKISSSGSEPHADGEIWSETLWDLRAALGSRLSESLLTRAMELSPAAPSFLDERNAILQADTVVNGGRARTTIWKVFAHRGMGYFAAAFSADDTQPDEDFSLPPGPGTPQVTLTGKVTDDTTGAPVSGVAVSVSGHSSGFPGADLSAVTKADGSYVIPAVPAGTYGKVYASGNGYEPKARTVIVKSGSADADWQLRRDWAASSGGARITDFTGTDNTNVGCGPGGLIDMTSTVWGSDAKGGTSGSGVDPVHTTLKLPKAVNIGEFLVDPTAGCGDDTTASLGDYRIETSPDGITWATAAEGHFRPADTGRQDTVPLKADTRQNIQYVRLTMLGNQAADNGVDCTKDAGPAGCHYLDATELIVHGARHQG
ncbi:M36 family metallopeptidase [Streptomyces sp. NPDC005799]|uniref:M36 family metallopeptidase n=1 Tax=Streptomyces sp. NPDC005799 TaxID=3154678 RepID=UPI0033E0CF95